MKFAGTSAMPLFKQIYKKWYISNAIQYLGLTKVLLWISADIFRIILLVGVFKLVLYQYYMTLNGYLSPTILVELH